MTVFAKLLGIAAFAAKVFTGAAAAPPPPDLRARADAIVEAVFPADGPGAVVIIARGGRTIYAAGRGLADVETRRTITPETVFRLGSITKQFTAAVILQLVQEGRFSLDDPLTRFFPDYPQPGGSATVRQVLNHTSGIQPYNGWSAETNRPHSTAEMIALFRDLPSRTPPGQAWAYNNSGYVLLAAIIEQVTGKSWHQAIEERIARPLGLSTIGYGLDREAGTAMARGYNRSNGAVQPAQRPNVLHGDGGLLGTIGDLAKWADALHHGRVVNPAMYEAMTAPASLPEGRTHPYGFGLELREVRGRRAIGHGGRVPGFVASSLYIPSEDLFVATFANSTPPPAGASGLTERLAALAMNDPFVVLSRAEVDPQTLAPLFGVYGVGETGATRRFFSRDGKLYTVRDGGTEQEVFAAGGDRFFYGPNSFTWFRVERRPNGAHVMEMHQNGSDEAERSVRTGNLPATTSGGAVPQSRTGSQRSEEPTVDMRWVGRGADDHARRSARLCRSADQRSRTANPPNSRMTARAVPSIAASGAAPSGRADAIARR